MACVGISLSSVASAGAAARILNGVGGGAYIEIGRLTYWRSAAGARGSTYRDRQARLLQRPVGQSALRAPTRTDDRSLLPFEPFTTKDIFNCQIAAVLLMRILKKALPDRQIFHESLESFLQRQSFLLTRELSCAGTAGGPLDPPMVQCRLEAKDRKSVV